MAQAIHLFVAVARRQPMREVEEALATVDKGFEACIHGKPGSKRQMLLMEGETLREFGLEPGIVKENITTRGIPLAHLAAGQRLQIGDALLEVTLPCDLCQRMDEIRTGLQQELRGRRGIMCRVVEGGSIHRGVSIEVIEADGNAGAMMARVNGEKS